MAHAPCLLRPALGFQPLFQNCGVMLVLGAGDGGGHPAAAAPAPGGGLGRERPWCGLVARLGLGGGVARVRGKLTRRRVRTVGWPGVSGAPRAGELFPGYWCGGRCKSCGKVWSFSRPRNISCVGPGRAWSCPRDTGERWRFARIRGLPQVTKP